MSDQIVLPSINEGTRTDRTVQLLADLITSGVFVPGSYLPSEPSLSKQLGVSRTTVRLALKTLELRGLVELRRGIGVMVADRTQEVAIEALRIMLLQHGGEMCHALEVRKMLECQSAELAAERATPGEIACIDETIDAMQNGDMTIERRIELDLEFHFRLCQTTRNPMLMALANVLRGLLRETIEASYTVDQRALPRIIDHSRILERVKAHDSAGASAAMAEHLQHAALRVPLLLAP